MDSTTTPKKIGRKTPPNFEVKNVKVIESMSEETLCFEASLYVDGKKVGHASNHGHGGPDMQDFDSPEGEAAFREVAVAYEGPDAFEPGTILVADAVAEYDYQKRARAWRREGLPVTVIMWSDDSGYGYVSMAGLGSAERIDAVLAENKPAMYRVITKED